MDTDGRMIVQLVANPAAARHRSDKVDALADALARAGVEVVRSQCGPGREFVLDARAGHVCVIGGDGTMREIALAAHRSGRSLPLSLYPAGTINLIHREAVCDLDPDRFAARILGGERRNHFAARIGEQIFLACASVGPDSAAVAALSPRLKRVIGRLAYAVAFAHVLLHWPRPCIRLDAGERVLRCEAFYVAKGRFFAGPWSFAPAARVADPTLHVLAFETMTRRRFAHFCWAMLLGRALERIPGATAFVCTRLTAECALPLAVQADGDVVAALPVEISLVEEPLAFV